MIADFRSARKGGVSSYETATPPVSLRCSSAVETGDLDPRDSETGYPSGAFRRTGKVSESLVVALRANYVSVCGRLL